MNYHDYFKLFLVFFGGVGGIVFGIIGVIRGKTRSHWWTGLRLVTREDNPEEYWVYIGLLFGIGIFALVAGILLLFVYF